MPNSIKLRASTFRFAGTRFTVFLRDKVIEIHNYSLRHMLEFLVEKVPNFTGETQATFRQFRDYLSQQDIDVQLKDTTQPEVTFYQYRFNKSWNIPEKIKNLPNAGFETAYGNASVFKCVIERQKFSITTDFTSGSEAFKKNPDLEETFEEAKAAYREFFKAGLDLLFEPSNFNGALKSFFLRGDLGG